MKIASQFSKRVNIAFDGQLWTRMASLVTRSALFYSLAASLPAYGAPFFTGVGDIAGGFFRSDTTAVSDDGSTVAGHSRGPTTEDAFTWTRSGGLDPLGSTPWGQIARYANGLSADGTVVVGGASDNVTGAQTLRAYRWSQATGFEDLGLLDGVGNSSVASAVSADGLTVVGHGVNIGSSSTVGPSTAFRWTSAGGYQHLPNLLPTNAGSVALDVSADGSVVVGNTT